MPSAVWRGRLTEWYRSHRRDLPWRRTRDPYAIWVSEIMLQQTQVATVLPYYRRWMDRFPDVEALAAAEEQDVLALWQGLGYYRRAKWLRLGAQRVVAEGWPKDPQGWLALPGIGAYTAAAIASIVGEHPSAVVDGNVERVFARFSACDETGAALLRRARIWANEVLDRDHPGEWNQAVMELGATVCTPRSPSCITCPIEAHCVARQNWSVERYPAAAVKTEIVRESHTVWVPYFEERFGVRQIPEGRWWAGLWEFPRSSESDPEPELRALAGPGWLESLGTVRHQVTQHRIAIEAWLLRAEVASADLRWHRLPELAGLPMPSPQRKVLALATRALGLAG